MNDQISTHPVHSSRAVFSVLFAFAVVVLVGTGVALMIGFVIVAGQAMTYGIAVVGVLILLGVLAVAMLLSITGVVLGWTAHRDPACKKLLPVLGLVFNGMSLTVIVPGILWLVWTLYSRGLS